MSATAGVPVRVNEYVKALFERLRFNVENDLPLMMGSDPGAFLAWMGLPPRTEEQDRRALTDSVVGGEAGRNKVRQRELRMLAKLARDLA